MTISETRIYEDVARISGRYYPYDMPKKNIKESSFIFRFSYKLGIKYLKKVIDKRDDNSLKFVLDYALPEEIITYIINNGSGRDTDFITQAVVKSQHLSNYHIDLLIELEYTKDLGLIRLWLPRVDLSERQSNVLYEVFMQSKSYYIVGYLISVIQADFKIIKRLVKDPQWKEHRWSVFAYQKLTNEVFEFLKKNIIDQDDCFRLLMNKSISTEQTKEINKLLLFF